MKILKMSFHKSSPKMIVVETQDKIFYIESGKPITIGMDINASDEDVFNLMYAMFRRCSVTDKKYY